MKSILATGGATGALMLANAALAADLSSPVYKAPPAAVASNGWYFWADGLWEDVRLPALALGARNVGPRSDLGPVDTVGTQVEGAGARGAIGYTLPQSSYASGWGSNLRIELGTKFITASGNQTSASPGAPAVAQQLLDGTLGGASLLCSFGFTCSATTTLHTNYETWELNGKVASDYRVGAVTFTPSLAIFGGNTHNDQILHQLAQTTNANQTFVYDANTALHWSDIGARFGADTSIPLASWLSASLGGYVGFAHRGVSFSGNDAGDGNFLTHSASAVAVDQTTTAFVANIEGGVNVRPWSTSDVTFRAFGGAYFDNRVPGVSSPSFTVTPVLTAVTAPAGILFASETNIYAGAGVMVRFR